MIIEVNVYWRIIDLWKFSTVLMFKCLVDVIGLFYNLVGP